MNRTRRVIHSAERRDRDPLLGWYRVGSSREVTVTLESFVFSLRMIVAISSVPTPSCQQSFMAQGPVTTATECNSKKAGAISTLIYSWYLRTYRSYGNPRVHRTFLRRENRSYLSKIRIRALYSIYLTLASLGRGRLDKEISLLLPSLNGVKNSGAKLVTPPPVLTEFD